MANFIDNLFNLRPLIETKIGVNGKTIIARAPASQKRIVPFVPVQQSIDLTLFPANFFQGVSNEHRATVAQASFRQMGKMSVRLRLTNSSAVTYVPTSFFFPRVQLFQQGAGAEFYTYFPVPHFNHVAGSLKDDEKTKQRMYGLSGGPVPWTLGESVPANSTLDVYYLLYGPWEYTPIAFDKFKSDLVIAFSSPPTGICAVGTTANVTCTAAIIVESANHIGGDSIPSIVKTRFLQPREVRITNQTITAAAETRLDLSSIDGLCCGLDFALYPQGTANTNVGAVPFNPYGLGEDNKAAVDLKDTAGMGILGSGGPAPDLKYFVGQVQDNRRANSLLNFKKFYNLPFCESSPMAAQMGVLEGYVPFPKASRYSLALLPGPAAVNEVQTITLSAAPTSGVFFLRWKSSISAAIAYNATTAVVNAAMNALPEFQRDGLSASFNAAFSAGTTVVCTITNTSGMRITESIGIVPNMLNAGAVVTASIAQTTAGNAGWVTAAYDAFIYAHLWRTMIIDYSNGGKITVVEEVL